MVKITDWCFSDISRKSMHERLLKGEVIIGDLYLSGIAEDHPNFEPGELIRTSAIEHLEYDMTGSLIVSCQSRMYLAVISPEDEVRYDEVILAVNTLLHRRASLIALANG